MARIKIDCVLFSEEKAETQILPPPPSEEEKQPPQTFKRKKVKMLSII